MLFFKRYLEKSQQVADHFESSQIPCYIKMRDLPAPPVVDHCRDLILSSCSLRFMPYTDDWIVVEYFADHDSDYLVSMYVVLSIEPTHLPFPFSSSWLTYRSLLLCASCSTPYSRVDRWSDQRAIMIVRGCTRSLYTFLSMRRWVELNLSLDVSHCSGSWSSGTVITWESHCNQCNWIWK